MISLFGIEGISPKQINQEFYKLHQRNLLGFGIFYLDPVNDEIKQINVDVVSNFSTTALCAVKCFRKLREQDFFKNLEKKKWIVWTDCGSHFRGYEMAHYLFKELTELDEPILVNLNFFAEKHGKNSRDQHFSAISELFKNQLKENWDLLN